MNRSIIYIPLLDEGTTAYRPTEGEEVAELFFEFYLPQTTIQKMNIGLILQEAWFDAFMKPYLK